jgi:hypothetical protein
LAIIDNAQSVSEINPKPSASASGAIPELGMTFGAKVPVSGSAVLDVIINFRIETSTILFNSISSSLFKNQLPKQTSKLNLEKKIIPIHKPEGDIVTTIEVRTQHEQG